MCFFLYKLFYENPNRYKSYFYYLEERVDDSEEETRIRNKTTFQKRALTKPAGKSRSGKKRRDLLVIEVPHDVGSSDIEIVRPGRHRKDSTSSQENSSQEVQRPRPKSRYILILQIKLDKKIPRIFEL